MLAILGQIGKGWGTISGIAVTAIGIAWGTDAARVATGVAEQIPGIVQGIGAILTAFGIGRKAGAAT